VTRRPAAPTATIGQVLLVVVLGVVELANWSDLGGDDAKALIGELL
jgi:hypothetical protein